MATPALATDAVVLRRVAYGDADLVLALYTRERGRLSALARGARSSRRRFGAALDLLCVADLRLRERPRSELWLVTEGSVRRSFAALATDMARLSHASYGTELVRELTAPEQPDPRVFDLLVELYDVVGGHPPSAHTLRAFELHLLDLLGLAPVLDSCVGCGTGDVDGPGVVLDPGRGGVICARCASRALAHGVRPLSPGARAVLAHAQRVPSLAHAAAGPPSDATATASADADADADVEREGSRAMQAVIGGHLGRPLRTVEFLGKLGAAGRRLT